MIHCYTFCPARGGDQVTKRIFAQCRGLIVHRFEVKNDDDVITSIYSIGLHRVRKKRPPPEPKCRKMHSI